MTSLSPLQTLLSSHPFHTGYTHSSPPLPLAAQANGKGRKENNRTERSPNQLSLPTRSLLLFLPFRLFTFPVWNGERGPGEGRQNRPPRAEKRRRRACFLNLKRMVGGCGGCLGLSLLGRDPLLPLFYTFFRAYSGHGRTRRGRRGWSGKPGGWRRGPCGTGEEEAVRGRGCGVKRTAAVVSRPCLRPTTKRYGRNSPVRRQLFVLCCTSIR